VKEEALMIGKIAMISLFAVAVAGAVAGTDMVSDGDTGSSARARVTAAQPSPFRQATQFGFAGEAIQGGVIIGDAPGGTKSLSLDGTAVPVADDGKFLIAFHRDAGRTATLVATLDTGRQVKKFFNVSPRKWRIEHVNVARRKSGPSAAYWARRKPEYDQIVAARKIRSGSTGWRQKFIWPAKGRISGVFGSQRVYKGEPGSFHGGVDVAKPTGTPFVAPADGVVILAANKPFSLEGRLLMIDHGMGLNSAFLHASKLLVKTGDVVKRGQTIGHIGATGRATGPHLHWGMKWNDARIDPVLLTGPMQ